MKKLMTTDDVAEIIGKPRQRVQIMCREGQIGYIKIPGVQGYLFTEEHVEECLKAHEFKPVIQTVDQTKQEGEKVDEQQSSSEGQY